jgi:hypothetical protein
MYEVPRRTNPARLSMLPLNCVTRKLQAVSNVSFSAISVRTILPSLSAYMWGEKVRKEWAHVFEKLHNVHRAIFLTKRNGKMCLFIYLLHCVLCKYNRPHCFLHFDRIVRRGSSAKRTAIFRSIVLKWRMINILKVIRNVH